LIFITELYPKNVEFYQFYRRIQTEILRLIFSYAYRGSAGDRLFLNPYSSISIDLPSFPR